LLQFMISFNPLGHDRGCLVLKSAGLDYTLVIGTELRNALCQRETTESTR